MKSRTLWWIAFIVGVIALSLEVRVLLYYFVMSDWRSMIFMLLLVISTLIKLCYVIFKKSEMT